MSFILGLDLGSNSIGWAMVDEQARKILLSGVRVFPEGVDRDKQGGEVGKNENRRIKRGMRRQILRRAGRRKALRAALVRAGMLPETAPESEIVLQLDPYELRSKGLDQQLSMPELGRVLIHLNQRRGFKSNRKGGKAKEEKGMLAEIGQLADEIRDSQSRTLGEYLFRLRKESGQPTRMRGRHTRRQMIQDEFELLWKKQREFYPDLLTDSLRNEIWDRLIAYQRPMYWPASVVGRCELEPREKRCRREHPVAQRFRMLQEVNNLRVLDATGELRPLVPQERERLIAFLSTAKDRTFDDIREHLGLMESHGFNLEFGERKKLLGLSTDCLLAGKKLFGPRWRQLPPTEKNGIIDLLLEDEITEEGFIKRAEQLGAGPDLTRVLLDVNLGPGYASYSLAAMWKLIPFLEAGLPLSGRPGEPDALHSAGYLRPDERAAHRTDLLPEPPEMTNPLVRAALFQLRQVVNAIVREFGKPAAIHVELAREIKGTAEQRRQMTLRMRENENKRDGARKFIRENTDREPTHDSILRYLLWMQQGQICIYSGRPISCAQLFGGEVDIDHILPHSRSLDDSQLNKVVVFRSENQAKGDLTPYEWLAAQDPEKYEAVLQRAARLPYEIRNAKRPKFTQRSVELTEFIERQLNDTKYISRKAAEYLRCLGIDVVCTKGLCTSELRYQWGLNSILRDDGLGLKNREDHRHHAVDAIVIASTDRRRLQALARARGTGRLPEPWANFRESAAASVAAINVSHRVSRRVSGALHEETLYGPTAKPWRSAQPAQEPAPRPWAKTWAEDPERFVYRKPLEALTRPMVASIRDESVRQSVQQRLAEFGIDPAKNGPIPAEVWRQPLHLPGPKGAQIKKVRLLRADKTIQPIRSGRACVKTGNNHHLCLFETTRNGKVEREAVWVSMLEAARRVRDSEPIIQRAHPTDPAAKFVMSLSGGELVLVESRGEPQLWVYQTGASTTGQLFFCTHTDARKSTERKRISKYASTLRARKITVDTLGRIRWAND